MFLYSVQSTRWNVLTGHFNALLSTAPTEDVHCPLCQVTRRQEKAGKTRGGVPCYQCQVCGCRYTYKPTVAQTPEVRELFAYAI